VVPYNGGWSEAGIYRSGLEFNHPLVVRKTESHGGTLPKRWGFLTVSHGNVVTSALKPGPEGRAILRVYEAGGKSADGVKITFAATPVAGYDANLVEETGRKLDVSDGLRFSLRAYEIKTFKLQFGKSK
jgi:alpha-mannosidase